jgi:hypothetical protein
MSYDQCCVPQWWWGWWQWTQYWGGVHICNINCGNCLCSGSGAAPRGFAGTPTTEVVVAPPEEKNCHCDHGFIQRLRDFVEHNNRMRKTKQESKHS